MDWVMARFVEPTSVRMQPGLSSGPRVRTFSRMSVIGVARTTMSAPPTPSASDVVPLWMNRIPRAISRLPALRATPTT